MCKELWLWSPLAKLEVNGELLFRPEATSILASRTERVLNRGISFDLPNDALTNFMYLQLRNRYWIGQQSYWSTRNHIRFDPLYNVHLIAAAYKLDFWRRKSNFVGLDSMKLMQSELLTYPWYGSDRISDRYRKERSDPERTSFPQRDADIRELNLRPRFKVDSNVWTDAPSEEEQKHAVALGISALTMFGINRWASSAHEFLLSDPVSRQFFNNKAVNDLFDLSKLDQNRAKHINSLIGMLFRSGALLPSEASSEDRFIFS